MLLSAQDLFTCLAHIIYIYIAYIFRSWEVWSCSCRRRTDLHVLQILNIYICIAYIFRWCFWSCFCRRRTYLHVLHILYIYIHCLYIQVMLLVMLLLAQDLFTCLAHIIYIYIHCLYIQVKLLVLLLSAQDLFTCLAHIIYIYIYTLLIYSGDASGDASVGAGLIYMSCTYYICTLLVYSGDASGHASVGAGLIYMSCTYYIYIYILLVYSGDAFGSASVGAGLIYMSCKSTTFISMIQIHQDQNIHQSASWGIWNASIFQARSYVSQNMSFVWDVDLQNDTYHHMMYSFPILGNFFLAPACILCFAKQLDHGKLVQVLEHRCYGWVIHLTLRDQLIGDRKSLKAIQ